ncbi:MAG: hypothetical protein ACOX66_06265 [Oscillospiraceae bacterium]
MKKIKMHGKAPEDHAKKPYPLLPYLIGLFVMVVVLVVLSYLMQLRNRQELAVPLADSAVLPVTETADRL